MSSNPNTSKLQVSNESTHWMRFNNKTFVAQDNITSNLLGSSSGYGYRKVHFTNEVEKNKTLFGLGSDKIFFDDEWDVRTTEDLKALESVNSGRVVLRRLSHLYPSNSQLRPKFFPAGDYNQPLKKVEDLHIVPHFLHEMGLFPSSDFRSLFFTQDFQPSGMYHAVVNYNGRWQTDVVDDFIPVYQKSGKPLWGMDLQQPWQLILLKFWAKRNYVLARDYGYDMATKGGYVGVKNAAPFEFVNYFTSSNWKFVNLGIDWANFLRNNVNRVHKAHFILKSKNSSHVKESGLIPNQACYELVNLVEQGQARNRSSSAIKNSTSGVRNSTSASKVNNQNTKRHYIATIRSSNKVYWAGKKSVLDTQFKTLHKDVVSQHKQTSSQLKQHTVNDKRAQSFGLDRYFTIDGEDLKNLFSCCYISTRRIGNDFISGFHKFTVPKGRTNAYYLRFNIPKQTFLDFSIKQLPSNKIAPKHNQSRLQAERHHQQHGGSKDAKIQRFLTNKYILVKDNEKSDTTPGQVQYEKDYKRLHYQTYEIQYLKGYNSGDAHFLNAVRGTYILRFKSESIDKDAHYVINYSSQHDITFQDWAPNKQEQTKIMKDALASTIDKVPRTNLNKTTDSEVIAYGNTFDYVGYGYIGAKLKKSSKLQLLIDVDPVVLKNEGYRLKHLYKTQQNPFAIVVNPGEATAVVLKKIDERTATNWPPKGIAIFQK